MDRRMFACIPMFLPASFEPIVPAQSTDSAGDAEAGGETIDIN